MPKYLGKYRGLIIDSNDPQVRGRVRVTVPELGDVPLGWALPCFDWPTAALGADAIPPVGTGVWLEFEAGDPNHPIWVGVFEVADEADT